NDWNYLVWGGVFFFYLFFGVAPKGFVFVFLLGGGGPQMRPRTPTTNDSPSPPADAAGLEDNR
ncbi:hypothetical protein Q0S99_20135, partial [Stenotrophomonas indicatrix]|uniref:hypothetical protein n=1 Tax=Stenotrophomonas indicatrix TaxID=2045451 RepID=UPI002655152F